MNLHIILISFNENDVFQHYFDQLIFYLEKKIFRLFFFFLSLGYVGEVIRFGACPEKFFIVKWFQQVIQGVHLIALYGKLVVGSGKNDSGLPIPFIDRKSVV